MSYRIHRDRVEIDETFRLLLMDGCSLLQAARLIREELTHISPPPTTAELGDLWSKYRGYDRTLPTHDLETGERLGMRQRA